MTEATRPAHVLTSVDAGVGTLLLNRPDVLNSCSSQTHREIQDGMDRLEADPNVGTIAVRGAGTAFCAGSDLRETGSLRGSRVREYIQLDFATKSRVAGCSKPTIAGVHGHCAGGGLELALACDIRIAAADARFSLREVELGAIPGSGGLQRLPSVVGLGVAKEWALTGRFVDAHEALDRGLVSRVVAGDALESAVRRLGVVLAQRSQVAVQLAKAAMDPSPPSDYGLTVKYHMIAAEVCHSGTRFQERTEHYSSSNEP